MPRPTLPAWSTIAGAGATAAGGGSWLITLAGVPRTTAIIVAATLLTVTSIAVTLPQIVKSTQEHKAGVLKAKGEVIRAKIEAKNSRSWTKTYNTIARAGLKSQERAERAERLLRMHALSPGLKEGQRLPDEVLDRHLTPRQDRTTAKRPTIPKDISGNGSVVPFQPAHDLSTCRSFRIGSVRSSRVAPDCWSACRQVMVTAAGPNARRTRQVPDMSRVW